MSISLHAGQSRVYRDLFVDRVARFGVVCCARGWGKSYMAAVAGVTGVMELMNLNPRVPNKTVWIIAPTYDQVTDIYYPLINYDLGMEHFALKSSRDLGRFFFPGNVELRLLSYEAVERMRGKGSYLVIWDEVSSCKKGITPKEAWQGVIQPTILTRWSPERAARYGALSPGRALAISTPKGYNFFEEMFRYTEQDRMWKSYHYDYKQSPFIDASEIQRIKHLIDPIEFASEYLASFEESGNRVFYCFDRKLHVRRDIPDFVKPKGGHRGEDIHVNIDFNVGIQASSIFALRGNQMHFLDEMQGHPDTETLAVALKARYPGHKIFAYPDPTGKSRKTSAPVGRTDFSILKAAGITVLARSKSPAIVDSVAAVNKHLKTAAGDVQMFFHPRVQGTIKSMERTKWVDNNPNTATIDKKDGIEHYSDGIRYGTEYHFPVRNGQKVTQRGFSF